MILETSKTHIVDAQELENATWKALEANGGLEPRDRGIGPTTIMTPDHTNSAPSRSPAMPNNGKIPLKGPYTHIKPIERRQQPAMAREHAQVAGMTGQDGQDGPQLQETPGPPDPLEEGTSVVKIEEASKSQIDDWASLDWVSQDNDDDPDWEPPDNGSLSHGSASTSHQNSPALGPSSNPTTTFPGNLNSLSRLYALPSGPSVGEGSTGSLPTLLPRSGTEVTETSRKRSADGFTPGDVGQSRKQRKISSSLLIPHDTPTSNSPLDPPHFVMANAKRRYDHFEGMYLWIQKPSQSLRDSFQ